MISIPAPAAADDLTKLRLSIGVVFIILDVLVGSNVIVLFEKEG
jgi:hypothetical protein